MRQEIRTFISMEIPDELKAKLSHLGKELNIEGIKQVEERNLHITLRFLGDIDNKKIGEIEKALSSVKFEKFAVPLSSVGVFPNENYIRVVWVGCETRVLYELAEKIENALTGFGFGFKKEQFSAHVTIARVKRKIDLSAFLNAHKNKEFGKFEAGSFELKMSQLGKEGPKYSTLASFSCSE